MTASVTLTDLAARGFALFPLRPDSKLPAVARDWEHAATTSPLRLRRLGTDPRANYAVACGPSNLVVLDLDVAKDPGAEPDGPRDGWQVLRELAEGRDLPRTFTVGTPSGGRHLYFRPPVDGPTPRNTVRRLGPLIDTRGVGGYVVAPGSRINGVPYRVLYDAPIAELPEWISTLLPTEPRRTDDPLPLASALGPLRARLSGAYARSALEREVAGVEAARTGMRNDTLNRAAYKLGTLIGVGLLDQAQVEAELTRAALAVGLDARETASTLRSGLTAGIAHPRALPISPVGGGDAGSGEQLRLVGDGLSGRESGRTDQAEECRSDHEPQPHHGPEKAPSEPESESACAEGYSSPVHEPMLRRPPRIDSAIEPGPVPMRAAAAARLEDTAPLVTTPSLHLAARKPVAVLIPAQEPESADWPLLFGSHVSLGKIAAALRHELRDAVPQLTMPLPESWPAHQLPAAAADLIAALADLDEAYDRGACASRPLVNAVRWHLIRTLADLLRELRDELANAVPTPGADPNQRQQPLSVYVFVLIQALCSAACLRIAALAAELDAQLALDGQRRSPLWNAVCRLQRSAEGISALRAGDLPPIPASGLRPNRYAVARTALESQLSAMQRQSHAA